MCWRLVISVLLITAVGTANASDGHLKWMYNATDNYYPFNTPFAPAVLLGRVPGDERVATLSLNNNSWTVSGLGIIDGTLQIPFDFSLVLKFCSNWMSFRASLFY